MAMESKKPLQLMALNHVSRVCSDLAASCRFYMEILGFSPVKRPSSFEFEGAWLHSYGIGLHLIKGSPPPRPKSINPKSCHISFQAASIVEVEESLKRYEIPFVKNRFIEDGVQVGQLFFHDPDDNMIEICNCDVLPVVPIGDNLHGVDSLVQACALPVVTAAVATAAVAWPAPTAKPEAPLLVTPSLSTMSTSSDAGSDSDSDSNSGTSFLETPSRTSVESESPLTRVSNPRPYNGDLCCDNGASGCLLDDKRGSFSSSLSLMSMSEALSTPASLPPSRMMVGQDDSYDMGSTTVVEVEKWRQRVSAEFNAVRSSSE